MIVIVKESTFLLMKQNAEHNYKFKNLSHLVCLTRTGTQSKHL